MNEDFFHLKYKNQIPAGTKAKRLAWNIVWLVFFRPTPRFCMHGWRRFVLRAFGADIGPGSKIDPSCRVWAPWNLKLGQYTALAENVDCYNVDRIEIGSKVAVSQRSFLCTASHRIDTLQRELIHKPIRIENHAWICAEAFIGPGVHIGEGAVVAARSVVIKDVPPWHVVGGNPAKLIKTREITT